MKTMAFSIVFALSSMAMASAAAVATCPSQTKMVQTCRSTPQAGDHEVAAGVFDSIAVCSQDSKTVLVFEKNGESDSAVADVTRRMGGTTYLVQAADVDFSLSVAFAMPSKTSHAQLEVNFKSNHIAASSTYTCTR